MNIKSPINERLILSLFDNTGNWAQPYVKAGYPVMLWDKQYEGDITDFQAIEEWLSGYEPYVYGILAAPPCTHFAASGARWWKEKDKDQQLIDLAILLVDTVLMFVNLCKAYVEDGGNFKFWALENPVGRIEKLIPDLRPYRRLAFNPCDYGDPYTKKTILWGEFNERLVKTPVLPLYGSMMHSLPPSEQRAALRSATPRFFAKSFFESNQ
jgi:hypothetical protein